MFGSLPVPDFASKALKGRVLKAHSDSQAIVCCLEDRLKTDDDDDKDPKQIANQQQQQPVRAPQGESSDERRRKYYSSEEIRHMDGHYNLLFPFFFLSSYKMYNLHSAS